MALASTLPFLYSNIYEQDEFEIYETHSFTKAVCDSTNYCEDFYVVCNYKKIIRISPTGAAVQFPDSWQDLRDDETKKLNC